LKIIFSVEEYNHMYSILCKHTSTVLSLLVLKNVHGVPKMQSINLTLPDIAQFSKYSTGTLSEKFAEKCASKNLENQPMFDRSF